PLWYGVEHLLAGALGILSRWHGRKSISINRAPVLSLWAAVAAQRLGFYEDEIPGKTQWQTRPILTRPRQTLDGDSSRRLGRRTSWVGSGLTACSSCWVRAAWGWFSRRRT